MKYPILNEIPTSRDMINVFGGYNHNLLIGDGEFYDMKNLSSDDYPVLAPRKKRGIYDDFANNAYANPQGLIAKDSLCYVDGSDFVINGYHVNMGLSTEEDMCPKSLVSMGSYVIIMPDKMYINTTEKKGEENAFEFGKIEASVTTTDTVTFALCDVQGTMLSANNAQGTNPQNGTLWIEKTDRGQITLYQYSAYEAVWTPVTTTYVTIWSDGIGDSFAVGDGVTISGITHEYASSLNGNAIICARDKNYIVVEGIAYSYAGNMPTQSDPITVTKKMPDMDFIIESQNRLWGCKYGIANNGAMVNEIYASKLGDFKNWNCFAGVSTDSYAASVGTDGKFTGAINYLGYPIFFKENCMHKVYGNYPANYQIQTTMCRGVQEGCSKSLAIVNEVVYYKSRSAVCAYDGSLPVEISTALGDVKYYEAVAGTLGNKYYISMADDNNEHHLFVYDTLKGMWHKEDDIHVKEFCSCRGNLYYIEKDKYNNKPIKSIHPLPTSNEDKAIEWVAETGVWGTEYPDRKYISRLDIRMSLNVGTKVIFLVEYDSSGQWEHLFTMMGTSLRTFSVPVKPKRCDHLRLRIEGEGEAKIYSICRTIEQGSDI